jgi:tRNA modification GTPase
MATARGSSRRVTDDTIVAVATPAGHGGLGVVRLSGPRALHIASSLFHADKKLTSAAANTLHLGWIKNGSEKIDQAVAAVFRAPHSYTGEHVVEVSCHGSPGLLQDVVKLAVSAGARLAKPGEFTERAYLNGKMDLAQAEAVAELIHAGGSAARAAAAEQLQGNLSARIREIREELIRFLAHVEANLDFVEEDIPGFSRPAMAKELNAAREKIEALLSTSLRGRILRDGLRVTLVGRPNVGKSSLFNALLASERAIVTNVPGTTRDVLEEKIEWDGVAVVLSDTAGLRETKNVIEREGTRRSRKAGASSDLILLVLDASSPLTAQDRAIMNELKGKSMLAVLNKADRGVKIKAADLPKKFTAVKTSATKGSGLADLKKEAIKILHAHSSGVRHETGVVVTNLRHVEQLEKAQKLIDLALGAVKGGRSEEALSVFIRHALGAIGAITGEAVTEDVLSAIFRQFCVGK